MFDNHYVSQSKGIPLVSYFRHIKPIMNPHIFTTMHYHSDMELLYITDGKAKMIVNGTVFYAEEGSLILINPYEVHYGEIVSDELTYYCIDFDIKMLSLPFEEQILAEELKYTNLVQDSNFEQYVHGICTSYVQEPLGWQLCAKGNLMILFSFLQERLVTTVPTKETEFSKRIINFICENYMKNVTSRDVAEELSYNHSYFCRVFKKSFAHTFSEYLNLYRINKAKEFLMTENVSNTAMSCGFSSISYFSVEFKRRCGMSPIEYKMSLRNKDARE